MSNVVRLHQLQQAAAILARCTSTSRAEPPDLATLENAVATLANHTATLPAPYRRLIARILDADTTTDQERAINELTQRLHTADPCAPVMRRGRPVVRRVGEQLALFE